MINEKQMFKPDTPESDFLEDVKTSIGLIMHEISAYVNTVNDRKLKEGPYDKPTQYGEFNKMYSVLDTIKQIQQSAKYNKINTKNPKLYEYVYEHVLIPLHKINENTTIQNLERVLLNSVNKINEISQEKPEDANTVNTDDEADLAYETYLRLFTHFPSDEYKVLKGLKDGFLKAKDYTQLLHNYVLKTEAKWLEQNNKTEMSDYDREMNFPDYLEGVMIEDFRNLWDEKFKAQWEQDFLKDQEKQKSTLDYENLKESIRRKLIKGLRG